MQECVHYYSFARVYTRMRLSVHIRICSLILKNLRRQVDIERCIKPVYNSRQERRRT